MKYSEQFKNPDRRYAIYPIIHGGIAAGETAGRHEDLGFAGVVGNVPYTREFPDNQTEWEETGRGFKDYIDRGMHTWIYDEKGYPSGTAGGIVTEKFPQYVAQGLYCYYYWRELNGPEFYRADIPDEKLFKALLLPNDGGKIVDVTHFVNENNVLYFDIPDGGYHLIMLCIRRLFDGTHATESYCEPRNYISLSDKDATAEFINLTHERYLKVLGSEFGKGVLAFFTDEPSLISWNIRAAVFPILPWHRSYPALFSEKYGYPFEFAAVAVLTKFGDDYIKRRCDFWEFIGDTVAEGFFGTIQDWCRGHQIKSSGHMLEEEHLQSHVFNYGSLYKCGKRFDWPGIDQLHTDPLELMNRGRIPIARLLASFADISGEGESFTEFSDHSMRMKKLTAPLEYYYASVNWHMALGINNLTSYYSFDGLTDDEIRNLNKYAARTGTLIREGVRASDAAVLYPEASMWAEYTPNTNPRAMDHSEGTVKLDNIFNAASWELLSRQIDFDYVDADLINEGIIENGVLKYNSRNYECIILPVAKVLEEKTAGKILEMADAGIGIICIGEIPCISRESGREAASFGKFEEYIKNGKVAFVALDDVSARLDNTMLKRKVLLTSDGGSTVNDNILSHSRITPDGTNIIFLANMGSEGFGGSLSADGVYSAVYTADPADGRIDEVTPDENRAPVKLKPYSGRFYIFQP